MIILGVHSLKMQDSWHLFYSTCVFPATSERPDDVPVLHESYRIPPRATFSFFFVEKNSRIPSLLPISVAIHIFPPPCMLPAGCQGMYGLESSISFNAGKVGLGPFYTCAMLI